MSDHSVREVPKITRNGPIDAKELGELRIAVGWDRGDSTDEQILSRRFSYYTASTEDGALVGFISVMSDGISDALLVDMMVHPTHHHEKVGTRLIRRAVADVRDAGIQCVQITCEERLTPFYQQCGFHMCTGGIIDFNDKAWGVHHDE
ncbi:MAG: GNAT family N-acetyltransferase [Spirochaetales bacterium]|jgi:GNAT superfamily N-acetyltransferase|nr:GNAT family N-acetyltransferase [Spirochaetales bacterium]